jgi:hypothetical protein
VVNRPVPNRPARILERSLNRIRATGARRQISIVAKIHGQFRCIDSSSPMLPMTWILRSLLDETRSNDDRWPARRGKELHCRFGDIGRLICRKKRNPPEMSVLRRIPPLTEAGVPRDGTSRSLALSALLPMLVKAYPRIVSDKSPSFHHSRTSSLPWLAAERL